MKFLIAPDKFKGSLSANEAANAIAIGISKSYPKAKIDIHPLADGGEGSIEILAGSLNLSKKEVIVHDPMGRDIAAHYYAQGNSAYIELAIASGLALLSPPERNPGLTSTIGTGQLIKHAINNGATIINLFLGGSATNDGGMGIATALGVAFYDKHGQVLSPIGENLPHIHTIDDTKVNTKTRAIKMNCFTDVENPFYGKNGAAVIFARQKGARESSLASLDKGLEHFSEMLTEKYERNPQMIAGSGAAGGVSGGLYAMVDARISSGLDFIFEATGFEEKLKWADWVITGEGKVDRQSLEGKVVSGVAKLAKIYSKKVALLAGRVELNIKELNELGVIYGDSIIEHVSSEDQSFAKAEKILEELAERFGEERITGK